MSKTVAQRVEEIPKHYQIHPLDLRIDKEIASGNFGSVFHGKLWVIQRNKKTPHTKKFFF